jgi:hypothetical protein
MQALLLGRELTKSNNLDRRCFHILIIGKKIKVEEKHPEAIMQGPMVVTVDKQPLLFFNCEMPFFW